MTSPLTSLSTAMSGYFAGIPEPVKGARPGLFSLSTLLNFHLKKYAFSTLHANVNDTPPLDPVSLVSRLAHAKAGYCFHHNVAFFEAMKEMHFKNLFFIAGTFPQNDLPTHIAIVWKKEEDDWYLVDPGSGYGISYAITFDPSKKNPGPYQIREESGTYFLEKYSSKTDTYEELYHFKTDPLPLESDVFQEAVQVLTTPKHLFYRNFWHFGMDRNNRIWNAIVTVNDEGAIESELLLLGGKKQQTTSPLAFSASKTNGAFHDLLNQNSFVNSHLQVAVVTKFNAATKSVLGDHKGS